MTIKTKDLADWLEYIRKGWDIKIDDKYEVRKWTRFDEEYFSCILGRLKTYDALCYELEKLVHTIRAQEIFEEKGDN